MRQELTGVKARAGERSRRLKRELKMFGTLRDLHRAVQARLGGGTRGGSYAAVRMVVEGKVDHPRPNVVEAIAATFGVRFEYLMDLKGPRTQSEKDLTEITASPTPDDPFWRLQKAYLAVKSVEEADPWFQAQPPLTQRILQDTAIDILEASGQRIEDLEHGDIARVLEPLLYMWRIPIWAFRHGQEVDTWQDADVYALAWAQIFKAALPRDGSCDLGHVVLTLERIRAALFGKVIPDPKHYQKAGGMWWAGPFCPNDEHRPDSIEMEFKGKDRYVCPECGLEVVSPVAPGEEGVRGAAIKGETP